MLFALLIPWLFGFSIPVWPWIVSGALAIWGTVAPAALDPLYKVWMKFGFLMSRITTPIILGIAYFLVFTPVALVMRLFKRDRLNMKQDAETGSYRIVSTVQPTNKLECPY